MKKLLIIDPQVCFCQEGASLYVKGASEDSARLSALFFQKPELFDTIDISLDMHQRDDVAHPSYWINSEGKHPEVFTQITLQDLVEGKWVPVNPAYNSKMLAYLQFLDKEKKFTHTIWPPHAIAGTKDVNIVDVLLTGLLNWEKINKKSFHTHIKGMDRHSEHYGIFQGEGPGQEFNHKLIHELFQNENEVYVAGQAKSHCVATSLKQILEKYPQYISQITLISDATSNVSGFEHIADSIYEELERAGMQITTTVKLSEKELAI
jgi:nicotinamidase-related amidase